MAKPAPKESESITEDSQVVSTRPATKKRSKIWLYILSIVLIAAVWLWKQMEINRIKEEAETARQSIQLQVKQQVVNAHEEHLRLLAKPFVWALRTEMMLGNLSQVHLYINEMVKEKNLKNVVVANDKGIIVSSTNKKYEGQAFSTIGKESSLSDNATTVDNTNDSVLVMSSPIMGFNSRVGTLQLTYTVPPVNIR